MEDKKTTNFASVYALLAEARAELVGDDPATEALHATLGDILASGIPANAPASASHGPARILPFRSTNNRKTG